MLTIRLDGTIAAALDDEARRTNRSKGRIVRDAIAEHLRAGRPSALHALSKYAGILKGPADLSTNKAHLAGMGRKRRA